jgi:hypothetical protein
MYNPTNETLAFQWGGEWTKIPSGQKIELSDCGAAKCRAELLRRGVVQLCASDERNRELIEAGVKRNIAFKHKQVNDFNILNIERHDKNLNYISPSEVLVNYAKELHMGLAGASETERPEWLIAAGKKAENMFQALGFERNRTGLKNGDKNKRRSVEELLGPVLAG